MTDESTEEPLEDSAKHAERLKSAVAAELEDEDLIELYESGEVTPALLMDIKQIRLLKDIRVHSRRAANRSHRGE